MHHEHMHYEVFNCTSNWEIINHYYRFCAVLLLTAVQGSCETPPGVYLHFTADIDDRVGVPPITMRDL